MADETVDDPSYFHRRPTPQSTNTSNGPFSTDRDGNRLPRPKRIPSISYGNEDDVGESSMMDDHNASSRSLDNASTRSLETASTQSTMLHDSLGPYSHRRRRTNRHDPRLTKSLSTPSLRGQTSLDAICRAERRSNRERQAVMKNGGIDNVLLLSERRSLSPIARRHRDRPFPNRLSQLGYHTFYHRNDDSDDEDIVNSRKSSKPLTRRTTLPENIKPMQNDNESTIMEPNAMRYLPKILRDIYAQRQTRRPSLVSFLCCRFCI